MIELSHVTKVYKNDSVETVALDDVCLEVREGEFVAIMGASGSGKSTLMHIIGVLDLPTSGTYKLERRDITKLSDDELADIRNKEIGFVFQAYNLLPRISALRNVALPMIYAGIAKEKRLEEAKKLLEMVGLGNKLYNTPNQLSGGEQQRVAIARALAMDAKIILADEPTGNLATKQAEEIMAIFEELNKKGHTIVLVTHEPEVAKYSKRIVTLKDGKIIGDFKNKRKNL